MTDEMISYYSSINYQLTYNLLKGLMLEVEPNESRFGESWKLILNMVSDRFYKDEEIPELKQILEEHYAGNDTNLFDPEDHRYPHTKLLLSIRDKHLNPNEEGWDTLVRILHAAWYTGVGEISYDEDTDTVTMYTGGWSGNEDIIDALGHNIFAMSRKSLWCDPECPAEYYLRKPEYLRNPSVQEHQDRTMCRGK